MAYVLFATLADLDRSFHGFADTAAASPAGADLVGHVRNSTLRPSSSKTNWSYEAPELRGMNDEPTGGLVGVVRFPVADLEILNEVLA